MIALNNVTKIYDTGRGAAVRAVREVSLSIARGEFAALVGRSGSGKTTILNLAAGLTRPTLGSVTMDGVDLWKLSDREQSRLRNQRIGFVFQFPSLLPSLTVLENTVLPTTFSGSATRSTARNRAQDLLDRVGLADKLHAFPRQLSAGQQQRVVIARALINEPQVLFADEPTSNLDEKTELEIIDLFRTLHARLGVTVVLVTHTRQLVTPAMRAIEMADGAVRDAQPVTQTLGE